MGDIQDYFAGKVVLLTGATGLVGKILVEKFLRDLPDLGRLYVLIRPRTTSDGTTVSAQERLWQDVLSSSAFDPLRQRHGEAGFIALANERVEAVAGDLAQANLGMDPETYRRLQDHVQVIINCAAVVTFDAPLDAAVQLNTQGPKRVLEFAHGCRQEPMLVHVSTCYVNGTRQGPIPEEPLDPRRTVGHLRGVDDKPYDVDEELAAITRRVEEIEQAPRRLPRRAWLSLNAWWQAQTSHPRPSGDAQPSNAQLQREWLRKQLEQEGMRWARRRGWNDTYTFTKAMGEQLVVRYRGDLPTLIVRPSIIESAMETPQPGWLDGFRMLDPLIVAYGRGRLPDFPGMPESTLDIVPGDVVANALLAAVPWAHRRRGVTVYQIASGMENPLTLGRFAQLVQDLFKHEPLTARGNGRDLPQITFPSRQAFLRRLRYQQLLPLRVGEEFALLLTPIAPGRRLHRTYRSRRGALERLEYYIRIYGPYAEVRCQYQTHHMREVWQGLSPEERARFPFDIGRLDWRHYIQEVHIPGVKRFLLGLSAETPPAAVPVSGEKPPDTAVDVEEREQPFHDEPVTALVSGGPGSENGEEDTFPLPQGGERAVAAPPRPLTHTSDEVPEHAAVAALLSLAATQNVDRWIKAGWLTDRVRDLARALMGLGFRFYTGFTCEGVEHVPKHGPFIVVSSHASHLDTGALLVALGKRSRGVHPMAAKDYFFTRRLLGWMVHTFLGAIPFDREVHVMDSLALGVAVLHRRRSIIVFPGGGRSIDGTLQPFKRGIGLLVLASGVPIVPARVLGSFQALPKGRSFIRRHPIRVRFGPCISAEPYLKASRTMGVAQMSRRITADLERAVGALD